jgi:hypothetical protein
MRAPRCFPAATILLLNACVAMPPSDAEIDRLARASLESRKTGVCNIHHIRMGRQLVPVEYAHLSVEYFSSDYYYAKLREFPNAQVYALKLGFSSKPSHQKTFRYVCPLCRRAEEQWRLNHPHDEWAKLMANRG